MSTFKIFVSFLRRSLNVIPILMLLTPFAFAQSDTAIVVGLITDQSDALLPGTTVQLKHLVTNAVTEAITDDRGQFRTPPLRIGIYDIEIERPGFKRFSQQGVVLNIGDVRTVNAVLPIGEVTEVVSVEATAPLLHTADSTVGTVITNQQIKDLPLNGRDYLQLAAVSAGTTVVPGVGISIGGQAGSQVAFLLDGQDNNNQQIATSHSNQKEIIKPSVDAIQEFKVVTNGYSAEYGRSSAGVVTVSLKSGTNAVHGTVYEFLRNNALDARNFFATQKPPFRRNQFGAAIGGPIIKDKTFVFGDFESALVRQSTTVVSTLPSAAQRAGQFTVPLIDPLSGQPFPGNRISIDRFDPAALRVLDHLTLPQTASAVNNFVYNSPRNQDPRSWDFRVDHILSANQNVYFRYSSQRRNDAVAQDLPPDAQGNYYSNGGGEKNNNKSWVVAHSRTWSPSIVSSIRVGYNNTDWNRYLPDQSLKGIGLPGVTWNEPNIPGINITGYRALGIGTFIPNFDQSKNTQISGDLTWTHGAHTLKAGVQTYWMQTNFFSAQNAPGLFAFNGQYTKDAFADFLLGYASQATLSTWASFNFRTNFTHFFVQDDWRLSRRLTLNLGLRYELSPPFLDANNAIANFDMDTDPAHPKLVLAGAEGSDHASRALQAVNNRQFAPRVGFAYTLPDNKTVFRGGYGIFYSNLITVGGSSSLEINPPFTVRIVQSTDPARPSIFFNQGFTADALNLSNAQNINPISYDRRSKIPFAQQWNFNVQHELPGGIVMDIGYNANRFVNNWRSIEGNPALPGPGDINARRQFTSTLIPGAAAPSSLAGVIRIQRDGWSTYRALQTKIEKRYAKGLSLLASYTFSRTMALQDGYQDPQNVAAEISRADTDRPHYFVASGLYDLPFGHNRLIGQTWGRFANSILGGWSLGPIVRVTSGSPFDLTVAGNPSNSGVGRDRPNLVADPNLDNPTPNQWFNTAAFTKNAQFTFGNAPRNFLRGPGIFNLDIMLRKSFKVREGVSVDFRFESFNATNHTNFDVPNGQFGTTSFGKISSAGPSRSNQLGIKLIF